MSVRILLTTRAHTGMWGSELDCLSERTDRGAPKALSRLLEAQPALSLLMRLPPVGPGGCRETPYSTVHSERQP